MAGKRVIKKNKKSRKKSSFRKKIRKFEKQMLEDVEEVEYWVRARRKFLIKLAWTIGIVVFLLILSHFLLRVRGVGI
ncbi:hypothetical protein GF386_05690 [Candidatus Pacearchaeota archaeon]|nr:hypothetical protein [Candidatus Pacearchaeota archaeon]MBD3283586.1 hypothetical protein [Candidatus Pacearchaeota archaeon]